MKKLNFCNNPVLRSYDKNLSDLYLNGRQFTYFNKYKNIVELDTYIKSNKMCLYPCRKCFACLNKLRYKWVKKMISESLDWKFSYFITLTYNDENLPIYSSLNKRDYQNFLKRLRKRNIKFKYFITGEYGTIKKRPHYHLILFTDWKIQDLEYLKNSKGGRLYKSNILDKIWNLGFTWIAFDINGMSFPYVASYSSKELTKQYLNTTGEVNKRIPEFCAFSLREPLGSKHITTSSSSDSIKWLLKKQGNNYDKELLQELDNRKIDFYNYLNSLDHVNAIIKCSSIYNESLRKERNKSLRNEVN